VKSHSAAKAEDLIVKPPPVAETSDPLDSDAIDRLLASMASEPNHHDRLLGKFDLADEDEMVNDLEASFDRWLRKQ